MPAGEAGDIADRLSDDQLGQLVEEPRRLEADRLTGEQFLDAVVLSALTAERRFGVSRFELGKAAVRTVRTDLFGLPGFVFLGHVGPESLVSWRDRRLAARRGALFLRFGGDTRLFHRDLVRGHFGL